VAIGLSGGASGAAGGDLSGTYPNPTVSKSTAPAGLTVAGKIAIPDPHPLRWGDPTLGYKATTIAAAPLSYFGVDEGNGTFPDSMPTGLTGTLAGNTLRSIGSKVEGAAVKFGGALADKISFGNAQSLDFIQTDSFSLEFWLRRDGAMTDGGATINRYWIASKVVLNGATSNGGWGLYYDGARLCFAVENQFTGVDRISVGAWAPTLGLWNHVGISFTNIGVGQVAARTHINGALTAGPTTVNIGLTAHNARNFTLGGADADTLGGSGFFSWVGAMDEVAIYNRVVSTAEFLAHFNANVGVSYAIRESNRQGALKVDGALDVPEGVSTKELNTAGLTSAQIDAAFIVPPVDGAIISDPTNSLALVRQAGKWYKTAALTQIA
jgi:hypothetical protein